MRHTRSRARGIVRDGWAAIKFISQLLFILVVFGWIFYAWVWPVIKLLVMLVVLLLSPIWMTAWLLLVALWPLLVAAAGVFIVLLIAAPFVSTDAPTEKAPSDATSSRSASKDDYSGDLPN